MLFVISKHGAPGNPYISDARLIQGMKKKHVLNVLKFWIDEPNKKRYILCKKKKKLKFLDSMGSIPSSPPS